MADVVSLEGTRFSKGVSLEEYWLSTFSKDCMATPDSWQRCIVDYFDENWSSDLSKAIVYGMLSSFCFDSLDVGSCGFFVHSDSDISVVIAVMFGLRNEESIGQMIDLRRGGIIIIPPRYQKYSWCSSKEELSSIILDMFQLKLPMYLHMEHIDKTNYGDRLVTQFSNLRYLAVETTFGPNVHDLIIRIIRVATRLEMLSLSCDNHTTLKSLDLIIYELTKSCCVSSIQLLVAYSRFDSIDMGLFSVSYRCLKSLIDMMSVTAVAHRRQVIRLEGTTIVCNDIQELNELLNLHVISKKAPIVEMYKCNFSIIDEILL